MNRKATANDTTRSTLRLINGRSEGVLQGGGAVKLPEACRRIGLSYGYGRRLAMDGKFPIPCLPRIGRLGHYRFSIVEIDRYLAEASVQDARVRRR